MEGEEKKEEEGREGKGRESDERGGNVEFHYLLLSNLTIVMHYTLCSIDRSPLTQIRVLGGTPPLAAS